MFDNFDVYDITPLVSERLGVFPGDQQYSRKISLSINSGNNIDLSSIETTLHLGAHTDAPNHYHKDGVGIDQCDLKTYMGECQVISVNIPPKERIKIDDLNNIEINSSRILFKTNSFPDPDNWNSDFNSLSAELVDYLAKRNVKLIGIDTPSVDPEDAKELSAHLEIYKNKISILEGVILDKVKAGNYQLIALPLKLEKADASPVRAILLKEKSK